MGMKARLEPRINLVGRTALETVIPLATPFIVFVDPASSCNFKCTFCPTGHRDMIAETGRYQGAMKFDVFQKVIDDLAVRQADQGAAPVQGRRAAAQQAFR